MTVYEKSLIIYFVLYFFLFRSESTTEGVVYVYAPSGKLMTTITTTGAEISGLAISGDTLYITERSNGAILKLDIQ